MKKLSAFTACLLLQVLVYSQNIEGNQLLDLIGKPVTDPLFQQLKSQETFYTDAWDKDLTIYINRYEGNIEEVELQNGKIKAGSAERYGIYKRSLPLELNWNMSPADMEGRLGKPTFVSTAMNFSDYYSGNWKIRIFYENNKPVSIAYSKRKVASPATISTPPVIKTQPVVSATVPANTPILTEPLIRLDSIAATAQVNWAVLKQLILSNGKMKELAGNDSVDYIGQVYYNTPNKIQGFTRSAVKRIKRSGQWYYEAFYKITADSNQARRIFFTLYDNMKKQFKDNAGDDFILAAVAKKSLSETPVNWMAQWTLYSNYKTLPAGLKKMKVGLMLNGFYNSFSEKIDYTFKIYIFEGDLEWDFFTWDKPY